MTRSFGVYVAAAATADQAQRVSSAVASLRAEGFTVTCTWPEVVAATPGGSNPRDASDSARQGWSAQDLAEIDAADALWFLVPTAPTTTRGAWFESGYAYSAGKHILFSGDTKQSVFCALGCELADDIAALQRLRDLRAALILGTVDADSTPGGSHPLALASTAPNTTPPVSSQEGGELLVEQADLFPWDVGGVE